MILKLKNKTLLAMDKLIKEAAAKNGIPDCFVFEPREAADFLRDVKRDKKTFRKHVEIKQTTGVEVDVRFLMQSELTQDTLYMLINRWFKKEFNIFYQGIEITVTKKKVLDVPTPQGPLADDHVLTPDEAKTQGWETTTPYKLPVDAVIIQTPELEALPAPPTPPPCRIVSYDSFTSVRCESCGSSMHRKWGFFSINGCIQPECENYYKNGN